MPPHCDTRDGPVVTAAKQALQEQNVNYVLVWVLKGAEEEMRRAFDRTLKVRANGKEVRTLRMTGSLRPSCDCTGPGKAPRLPG